MTTVEFKYGIVLLTDLKFNLNLEHSYIIDNVLPGNYEITMNENSVSLIHTKEKQQKNKSFFTHNISNFDLLTLVDSEYLYDLVNQKNQQQEANKELISFPKNNHNKVKITLIQNKDKFINGILLDFKNV